jgi:hypothetical protein
VTAVPREFNAKTAEYKDVPLRVLIKVRSCVLGRRGGDGRSRVQGLHGVSTDQPQLHA